jgi:flagellar biosynthesis/type III secretory pathway protein FliH
MIRRFIPPAVNAFVDEARSDTDSEWARGREGGLAEGLTIGRSEGYAAGLREGKDRADERHQSELARLRSAFAKQHSIDAVVTAIEQLLAAQGETRRGLEDAARAAITSGLRTLFPVLMAQAVGAEIAALIAETVCEHGAEALTLRCHPETLGLVEAQGHLEFEALIVQPDDRMAPGTAVATWSGGGLSFDPAALLAQVVEILSPNKLPEEATPA